VLDSKEMADKILEGVHSAQAAGNVDQVNLVREWSKAIIDYFKSNAEIVEDQQTGAMKIQ